MSVHALEIWSDVNKKVYIFYNNNHLIYYMSRLVNKYINK